MTFRCRYTFIMIALIIGWALGGTEIVHAAQPMVKAVTYVDSLNVLEFVFDQPVFTDSTRVIRDGIELRGVVADKAESMTLSGGKLDGDPENPSLSDTVRLVVTFDDQKPIENMAYANPSDLTIVIPAGRFINEQFEGNVAITAADRFAVKFIPFLNRPEPVKAVYHADENVLGIRFNKNIQVKDKVDLLKISVGDNSGKTLAFTSNHEFVPEIISSDTVSIIFTPKHQQVIESFDSGNLKLNLAAYAFIDEVGNTCKAVDSFPISFIPDENPTEIDSAYYDAVVNKLYIIFNENIETSYKRYYWEKGRREEEKLDAVSINGITLYDEADSISATLTGYKSITFRSNTKQLEIMVSTEDQIVIETLPNPEQLKLAIAAFTFLDEQLNGIREYTLSDNITLGYKAETDKDAPVVEDAYYHADVNLLELRFGNIKPQTKGIDTTNVTPSWITLHNMAAQSVTLTGGAVHGVKAGVPRFVRNIFIEILPEDELSIERLSNGDSLYLSLKPLTFFFESYSRTGNGNHELPLDSQLVVHYVKDTLAAEVAVVKNNFVTRQLELKLNKRINYKQLNPTALNISGIQLSGGTVVDSSIVEVSSIHSDLSQSQVAKYEYNLVIDLTEADQAAIDALDVATKANIVVTFNDGCLMNLDGTANKSFTVADGDTMSDGQPIFVGYGRSFYDKSFEAFPTADQLVPASLRAVGDHSYIYVSDEDWLKTWEDDDGNMQRVITQSIVDSLMVLFEQQTPADDDKGIYDICREYFGPELDTDGDPRITILFTDLRDEYDQGRANRASNIPRAGAYLARNELPDSVDAHSAMTDMIYIDSYPIIHAGEAAHAMAQYFTHMIFRNVDINEEQWLIEGMGGLAPVLCGYNFTNHVFPAGEIKMAASKTLNWWTGWNGGTPAIDVHEFNHTSLFCIYLYEQFGGGIIQTIAADTVNGLQSVRNALPESITLEDVFDDYAIAGFLDKLNHPEFGDRYGFKAVDFGFPTLGTITWINDNVTGNQPAWSFSYYKTKKRQTIDAVRFNGIDATKMSLIFTTIADTFLYTKASLDEHNEGTVDISALKVGDVLTCVTSKASDGPTFLDYVISKDMAAPEYVHLNVMQHPSVDRNLTIYAISDEKLYQDIGTEGPKISISNGETTVDFIGEQYFANSDETAFSYVTKYTVTTAGTYTVNASGQDIAGNDFVSQNVSITARKVLAKKGGMITEPEGRATLSILAGSMARDRLLTAFTDNVPELLQTDADKALSPIYRFGPQKVDFAIPAKVTLAYDGTAGKEAITVCRLDGNRWVPLPSEIDESGKTATAYTDRLGDFRVMKGVPADEIPAALPTVYTLEQNFPNPFNPTTHIQYGVPKPSRVVLEVYNALGQRVAVLQNGVQEAGIHQVRWDASGSASGLYFYRIQMNSLEDNDSFSRIRKMMVIK